MLSTKNTQGTARTEGHPVLVASGALLLAFAVGACGGKAPPPKDPKPAPAAAIEPEPELPLEPEAMETGVDCVEATTECQGGVCVANVKNNCDKPVTCNFTMYALCKGTTTGGQARGTARDTFRAGDSGPIEAGANCEGADVNGTAVDSLECTAETLKPAPTDAPPAEGGEDKASGAGDGGAE